MLRFNEDIEKEIVNVIKEYEFASKVDDYLNYDFEGEKVIFSLSIAKGEMLPVDALQKIGEIIGGCFEYITVVNMEYRFYYTYSDKCVCKMEL
ncbi:hypothetical protein [Methanobrevibacter woesei]|uniref:hypothetical protein n=1 Tax=Methanobrevibacter woesei TaxID=190976 RepID=UPI0023F25620|nr:hypothetical protein [Methanobrevibacter woesei]